MLKMNPGVAFGDNIRTEKIVKRSYEKKSKITVKGFLLLILLFSTASLFIGRLIYLQVLQGSYYRDLSDSNRIHTQIIHAPRGIIFDRKGNPLVLNIPGFRQTIKKDDSPPKTKLLDKEEALSLIADGKKNIEVDSLRQYTYKDIYSHILGYIGQISEDEIKEKKYSNYTINDWIGKAGIEKEYEKILRGKDGKQLVEIDALGKEVRSLGQTDPVAGKDIRLTLDTRLQKAAFDATSDVKKGAVIVSKPDGEILAMVSRPSFDPNLFTQNSTYKTSNKSTYKTSSSILTDFDNQPLLDRAISGVYPPGSTFKLLVAAAGLEDNIINSSYSIVDTGILRIKEFSFANWYYTQYGRTEPGRVDVVKAISRSNDIFFYKIAELIGVDGISDMARKFGLGNRLGIDLPSEAKGTVPSEEWKKETIHEDWYLGDTYHYGIGQGYLLTTPLQVNTWTQTIANKGIFNRPYILMDQKIGQDNKSPLISEETISLIRKGMIASCSPGGVAFPLFNFKVKNPSLKIDNKNILPVSSATASASFKDKEKYREIVVACKTGTSQHGGEKTLPHAWITLFAPAYDPEVVITILNESSGEGSAEAAPIAKKILESYFSNSK